MNKIFLWVLVKDSIYISKIILAFHERNAVST